MEVRELDLGEAARMAADNRAVGLAARDMAGRGMVRTATVRMEATTSARRTVERCGMEKEHRHLTADTE
jgi:hypothetical protein